MGIFDLFKPVDTITPDEVRSLIKEKDTDEYCLLDVRQPAEYAQGHLPGARLIPLAELPHRLNEMDPDRYTVVYCRSGSRSRSAVMLLKGAGFNNIYNMDGGIMVYNGITASGQPESGMFCFSDSSLPQELLAVSWLITDGTSRFLLGVKEKVSGSGLHDLIDRLLAVKTEQKAAILELFRNITGEEAPDDFPHSIISTPPEDVMAGCIRVKQALEWAEGRSLVDIVEVLLSLEANTLDLYLKLARSAQDLGIKNAFHLLSEQETKNLQAAASLLDKNL